MFLFSWSGLYVFKSDYFLKCLRNVSKVNPDSLWLNLDLKEFFIETFRLKLKTSLSFQNIFKYVWPKKSSHEEKRGRKNAVDEFLVSFFLPELQVLEFVCDNQTFLSYQTWKIKRVDTRLLRNSNITLRLGSRCAINCR